MARLGVAQTCRLLGHQGDVIAMHHLFDLFVQSSIREGTPNAVLEAMALETPIVATDVGGTAELMTHRVHGLLVRPGSAAPLVESIETAVSDRGASTVLAAAARRRIETDLSFERRMQKVESIYQMLAATASAARSRDNGTPALAQEQRR